MAKRGQGEGSISKRDDGTWWARITVGRDENGKQKRKAFYGKTRKEVQEKMAVALNNIDNNTFIDSTKITLGKWLDMWLLEYKKNTLRDTTYGNYSRYISMDIKPTLGDYLLKDLRNETIQRWVNQMSENGATPNKIKESY